MLPETLEFVWRCACCPEVVPVVTVEDVAGLTQDEVRWLVDMGVLRPVDTVRHVECLECGEDHGAEVARVCWPDGAVRFFAVCGVSGRVEIERERLLQWGVDFGPVLAAVMAGFGLAGGARVVVPGRVWELGRCGLAGQSRVLWVVRGLGWADGGVVAEVVPGGRSVVVFVLGEGGGGLSMAGVARDAVFDLRGVLRVEDGAWVAGVEDVESQLRGCPAEGPARVVRKRASRAAAIDGIKKALRAHLRAARDRAFATRDRDAGPELLPRPTEAYLAEQLGLSVSSVSRALNDAGDSEIRVLWAAANDVEGVMKFRR